MFGKTLVGRTPEQLMIIIHDVCFIHNIFPNGELRVKRNRSENIVNVLFT